MSITRIQYETHTLIIRETNLIQQYSSQQRHEHMRNNTHSFNNIQVNKDMNIWETTLIQSNSIEHLRYQISFWRYFSVYNLSDIHINGISSSFISATILSLGLLNKRYNSFHYLDHNPILLVYYRSNIHRFILHIQLHLVDTIPPIISLQTCSCVSTKILFLNPIFPSDIHQ